MTRVPWLLVGGMLLLWEALATAGLVSPVILPPPSAIAWSLLEMVRSGELGPHLAATLWRLALGLLTGAGSGTLLGLWMGASPGARRALDPLVAALHPLPKIALLPILLLLLGLGELPQVALAALAALFPALLSTVEGVRSIDPVHLEVARVHGASPRLVLLRVLVPGSLPAMLTGIRLGANSALIVTIAAELLIASRGLGRLVWHSWEILRAERLFATLVVVAAIGCAIQFSLNALRDRLAPWRA